MAKISMLLPNQDMFDTAVDASDFYELDTLNITTVGKDNLYDIATSTIKNGAEIIISRGGYATALKSIVNIPIVEIKVTSLEIGIMLQQAKTLTDKEHPYIALSGPENMFSEINIETFERLYDVKFRAFLFVQPVEMVDTAQEAIRDGADVIIGGPAVFEYCQNIEFPCMRTMSGSESIRESCRVAKLLSYALDQEKQHAASLNTLLDYADSGIIHINEVGSVLRINKFMENLFAAEAGSICGMPIWKLIPTLTRELLKPVLGKLKKINSLNVLIGENEFLVSISPIELDKKCVGAIISFFEGRKLLPMQNAHNKKLLQDGYYAVNKFENIISRSSITKEVIKKARHFSTLPFPVLIYGEQGTEKREFAGCIHNESSYNDLPFIQFNCNAFNPEEVNELLFRKPVDAMESGIIYNEPCTLYLHEISYLSEYAQFQLLDYLYGNMSSDSFYRPESAGNRIRIIASSSRDIEPLVEQGLFRRDLYYILSVMTLNIPSLKDHPDDIPGWIELNMHNLQKLYGHYVKITKDGMDMLQNYVWPGNLLELATVCRRIIVNATSYYVDTAMIKNLLSVYHPEHTESKIVSQFIDQKASALLEALEKNHGDKSLTAKELGISTTTLWRRMSKYQISSKDFK